MTPLHRRDFPMILNHYGLTNSAVEVGTHQGEYAELFLDRWKGRRLFCVDPWSNPSDYQDTIVEEGYDRENDYRICQERLKKFNDRAYCLRSTSKDAASWFREQVDFVYIDADHHKVEEDINLWWPLVKAGGFIAGHDITGRYGTFVKEAVENVFGEDYQVCNGDAVDRFPPFGDCASWFKRKTT